MASGVDTGWQRIEAIFVNGPPRSTGRACRLGGNRQHLVKRVFPLVVDIWSPGAGIPSFCCTDSVQVTLRRLRNESRLVQAHHSSPIPCAKIPSRLGVCGTQLWAMTIKGALLGVSEKVFSLLSTELHVTT